jgi:hypothetical protein
MASPILRLKHFAIGDTVTIKGAGFSNRPFFIGGTFLDGLYYLMWRNKSDQLSGKPWAVLASIGIEVEDEKSLQKKQS